MPAYRGNLKSNSSDILCGTCRAAFNVKCHAGYALSCVYVLFIHTVSVQNNAARVHNGTTVLVCEYKNHASNSAHLQTVGYSTTPQIKSCASITRAHMVWTAQSMQNAPKRCPHTHVTLMSAAEAAAFQSVCLAAQAKKDAAWAAAVTGGRGHRLRSRPKHRLRAQTYTQRTAKKK